MVDIDWTIDAIYQDDEKMEPLDMHTHGLEKHDILNMHMLCPTKDLVERCSTFIDTLADSMISGEEYEDGIHIFEMTDNPDCILDVFELKHGIRDDGIEEEKIYMIEYWFDKDYVHPNNGKTYRFNKESKDWEEVLA